MNYMYHYQRLIQKRREFPITRKDCYCEKHHIIPKSLGGSDDQSNLIMLTAREHFIAHRLLLKHYQQIGDTNGIMRMGFALGRLATGNKKFIDECKLSSREYEQAKLANSKSSELRSTGRMRYHNENGTVVCVRSENELPPGNWIRGNGYNTRGSKNWTYIQHRITGEVRHVRVSDDFVMPDGFEYGGQHPQQHTVWITDGENNRKIDKSMTIPEGWRRGRTICDNFRRVATSTTKGTTGRMWIHNSFTDESKLIKRVEKDLFIFPGSPFELGPSKKFRKNVSKSGKSVGGKKQKITKHKKRFDSAGIDCKKFDLQKFANLPYRRREKIWDYINRCQVSHLEPSYDQINFLIAKESK